VLHDKDMSLRQINHLTMKR